ANVARNETGYAILFADADGVVIETLAEPGQVVGAGQIVARVARAGLREAIIELPETLRPAIGSIGRATLYGSGLTGPAKLRQLSDAANRHTRTFEARYVLEGPLADAPLGSTISIQISEGRSAPALQVPIGASFDPGKGPGVWRIEGETPRVRWRAAGPPCWWAGGRTVRPRARIGPSSRRSRGRGRRRGKSWSPKGWGRARGRCVGTTGGSPSRGRAWRSPRWSCVTARAPP